MPRCGTTTRTPPTIGYEQHPFGAVVLVAFPFTDQTTSKQRPAVVISSTAYQRERPDLIILAITRQVRVPRTFGEAIVDELPSANLT